MGVGDQNDKVEDIQTFNAYKDADIVLRTSDQQDIWAHKLILARASSVFRSMFQSSESELRVPVTEAASAFTDLLQIIYPDFILPPIQVRSSKTYVDNDGYSTSAHYASGGLGEDGGGSHDVEQNGVRLEEIERLRVLLELTSKYDMPVVQKRITEAAKDAVPNCPIDCYAFALRYEINHQLEPMKLAALRAISENKINLSLSADTRRILQSGIITGVEYYDLMWRAGTYYTKPRKPTEHRLNRE